MVDAAAQAIGKVPWLWIRELAGAHEVCRDGPDNEPEIVRKFGTFADAETWAHDETRRLQARAALEAALPLMKDATPCS